MNPDDTTIRPGVRLGHYEVLSAIGRGGMGEVWKARDTTLDRIVAIKALPDAFANDSDRLDRLAREAKLLAALNHPNVAAIHGLEQMQGVRFLVMEFVDGPTLEEQLQASGSGLQAPGTARRARGLPMHEALTIALQLAESLEAAHEKGIIHRDLKPANIKVTPEGRVKVLDFGLAKAVSAGSHDSDDTSMPTMTGVVMGTPAYMSPEQARGESVGAQTDVWAFGAVLYEMLTGLSPFGRSTTADTLAQVIGAEPDYSLLPPETPGVIRSLVRRCLEKNQRRRFQHMGDLRIQIEDALASSSADAAPASTQLIGATTKDSKSIARVGVAIAVAVALASGVTGWLVGQRTDDAPSPGSVQLSIPFAEPPHRQPFGVRSIAISEDGSRIAYASTSRLWTRRMDEKDPIAIGPTGSNPFFSPSGDWIGLFREGLIKVPVGGGQPVGIAETSDRPAGATWGTAGTIVFATTEGLFEVSESGGDVRQLAKPDRQRKERLYAWPHFLPGGRTLLFTIVPEGTAEGAKIAWLDVATLETRVVVTGGSGARYLSTGHLLYASGATLNAVAFDADTGRTQGDPVSLPGLDVTTAVDNGAADFAVSQTGTLVYSPAGIGAAPGDLRGGLRTLSWIDRQGREEPLPFKPASYNYPRVSPDGRRVAAEMFTNGNRDIWILNLERLTQTQLTDGPTEDMLPVWAPNGERVFFASDRAGNFDVYSQASDGATPARVEFAGPAFHTAQSLSPDGTRLLVYEAFKDTGLVTIGRTDRLDRLLYGESDDRLVQFSPDGNWIVYESNESGDQFEIFVRPFPNVGERRETVSSGGGRYPLWGPKGDEIVYVGLDGSMRVVPFIRSPKLSLGRATTLFQWEKPPTGRSGLPYDISRLDGRFLVTKPVPENTAEQTQLSVVLNFFGELLERLPRR